MKTISPTNVTAARSSFKKANRILFDSRKQKLEKALDGFLNLKTSYERNKKLNKMALALVRVGYYAEPPGFDPEKENSLRSIRAGIGRYIFKEWWKRRKEEPSCKQESRITAWLKFCSILGWDPVEGLWIKD